MDLNQFHEMIRVESRHCFPLEVEKDQSEIKKDLNRILNRQRAGGSVAEVWRGSWSLPPLWQFTSVGAAGLQQEFQSFRSASFACAR